MSATIQMKCVLSNPQKIAPRPGVQLVFTVSEFHGFEPPLGFPILTNSINLNPIPFASGFASASHVVANASLQYWVSAVATGGSDFIGNWNDTEDVFVFDSRQFGIQSTPTTMITLKAELRTHVILK